MQVYEAYKLQNQCNGKKKDYHALFRINQLETEGGKCEGGDLMFRKCTYRTYPELSVCGKQLRFA